MHPGDLFAQRFVLEELAGEGGMGTVWRARDQSSGELVAVKVLSRAFWGEARLMREARVLSEISHPAIVRYVDHGMTQQGRAYLAMEWLAGEDLAARLLRGRLEINDSIALLRRICGALSVAHQRGVTHRDIKPSN